MLLLTQGKVYHEYYSGKSLSGAPTNNWIVNGLNFSNGDLTNFWGPVTNNISAKIIFFLKSPYSGTINMKVRYDDGFSLWVNDAVKFGPVWGSTGVIDYFNLNLVKDQLYSFYSEWWQGCCPFYYTLYMNYPGVTDAAISSSDLFLPYFVGASPYNINIADSICGDGFRTGTESWDDGNKNNGDGWSSVWSTESGWTWLGGSQSNKDICREICGDGITIEFKCEINYFPKWWMVTFVIFYLNGHISFWQSSREQDNYLSISSMFTFICLIALDSCFNYFIGWFSKSINNILNIKNFNFSLKDM